MFKLKTQDPRSKISADIKCKISKARIHDLSFVLCHYFVICVLYFVITMSGCTTLKNIGKGLVGVSTKEVEDTRQSSIKKTFPCDYDTCYMKVKDMLKERGSYIYSQDAAKTMFAIYVSQTDTTPVGIFFKTVDANNTEVEVSSPSIYAKELIARRIADIFEPEEKK